MSDPYLLQPESDPEQTVTSAKTLVDNGGKWRSVPDGSSTMVQLCSALGSLVEDTHDDDRDESIVFSDEE